MGEHAGRTLAKCAEAIALRKAFPRSLSALRGSRDAAGGQRGAHEAPHDPDALYKQRFDELTAVKDDAGFKLVRRPSGRTRARAP